MDTLFLVAMIAEAIFGLGLLLVPVGMFAPFGVILDVTATTFARLLGAAALSFAMLLWFARRSGRPEFKSGIVCSLFAYYLVSGALLVAMQIAGRMNALGWSVGGVHVLLLVWFGYFLVRRPASVF
jgi:hypothetical protein